MITKCTLTSISAALVLLGSVALVACGGGPDKVQSPVDQDTAPTDPVDDPKVPTDPVTEGAGGGDTTEPKTEEGATEETEGEVKPDEAKKEGEAPTE